MEIARDSAATVKYSKAGLHSSAASMSRKATAMRRFAATGEACADMAAPMQDIVEEEEEKREVE